MIDLTRLEKACRSMGWQSDLFIPMAALLIRSGPRGYIAFDNTEPDQYNSPFLWLLLESMPTNTEWCKCDNGVWTATIYFGGADKIEVEGATRGESLIAAFITWREAVLGE